MLNVLLWLKTFETNLKAAKFKVNDRVRITTCRNTLSKGYTENWSREIFTIESVLKLTLGHIKLKI